MWLGLIDRLRRLARRREAVGRHRRDAASNAGLQDGGGVASAAFQSTRLLLPAQRAQRTLSLRRTPLPRPTPPQPTQPAVTSFPAGPRTPAPLTPPAPPGPPASAGVSARGGGGGGGTGRARIRELPADAQPAGAQHARARHAGVPYAEAQYGAAPVEAPPRVVPREPWYQVVTGLPAARPAPGRVAAHGQALAAAQAQAGASALARPASALPPARVLLPYVAGHPVGHPPTVDGRRNCGPLEPILHRQWHDGATLPAAVVTAIDRLAELPRHLQQKLADGLTGVFVGPGGVPELDEMGSLRGVALPSGRATWDACAGAYGERKLVVGSRM
jgi:hypothetical protein